jgi:triosephosphate isomerase
MKMIVGNWKMNVGVRESVALARGALLTLRGRKIVPEVVICPSFIALSEVRKVIARSSVGLGAQDVFWEDHGAFTGETSGRMLAEIGVTHVIVGHSERRAIFGETDEMVNKKVLRALGSQLMPILCIGETAAERAAGKERDRVREQLARALLGVRLKSPDRLIVAYEPIWAISTAQNREAEVSDVLVMHEFVRSVISEIFPALNPGSVRVIYGGSVDGTNAYPFLRESQIDGVLVGSASIKLNQFKEIIEAAGEVLDAQHIK